MTRTRTLHRTRTRTRTRLSLLGAAVVAVTLPLALASCSSDTTTGSTADTASERSTGIGADWGSCMRDAGFDVQDPSDDEVRSGALRAPSGTDEQGFVEAGGACSKELGISGTSEADKQKWERQNVQVASCIRDHGYPDFEGQDNGVLDFSTYERSQEPEFQEAVESCLQEFAPDIQKQQVP